MYVFDPLFTPRGSSDDGAGMRSVREAGGGDDVAAQICCGKFMWDERDDDAVHIAAAVCGQYSAPPAFSGKNDAFHHCRNSRCPACDPDSAERGGATETALPERCCPWLEANPTTHMSYLPRYRWLLIGERGSGSAVHLDPAGTTAFNALIVGSKKWVFFPPDTPRSLLCPDRPPSSGKKAYSAEEWFRTIYPRLAASGESGRLEVTQRAGEIVYVPRHWWHAVLNLELTVAVTQNFGFVPAEKGGGADGGGGRDERPLLRLLREEFEAYDPQSAAAWWQSYSGNKIRKVCREK